MPAGVDYPLRELFDNHILKATEQFAGNPPWGEFPERLPIPTKKLLIEESTPDTHARPWLLSTDDVKAAGG